MTDPAEPGPPGPQGAEAPPDPLKAGRTLPRSEIVQGFGIGLLVSWGLRLTMLGVVAATVGSIQVEKVWPPVALAVLFGPTLAMLACLVWAARTGRKAWAIGMAIYAGVAGLLVGPFLVGAGLFVAICGRW